MLKLKFQLSHDGQSNFILLFHSLLINHPLDIEVSVLLAVLLYKTQINIYICTFTTAQNTNTI